MDCSPDATALFDHPVDIEMEPQRSGRTTLIHSGKIGDLANPAQTARAGVDTRIARQ